jgi:putative oxidoreductase
MKHGLYTTIMTIYQTLTSFGPLSIRILAGISFIAPGLPKLLDITGIGGFFASVGLPAELALPIGLLELMVVLLSL